MRFQWKKPDMERVWKLLGQYKYVLIVLAVGLALLLWPAGEGKPPVQSADGAQGEEFDLAALEGSSPAPCPRWRGLER